LGVGVGVGANIMNYFVFVLFFSEQKESYMLLSFANIDLA